MGARSSGNKIKLLASMVAGFLLLSACGSRPAPDYMSPPYILDQQGTLLLHKDPNATPVYYGPLGGEELAPTYWIQQWNILDELPRPPDPAAVPDGCDQSMSPLWGAANSQARVCAYPDPDRPQGTIIELAQSGPVLNEDGRLACSREYNLFISPIQANAADFLGIDKGFAGYDDDRNIPLSGLDKLLVRMQVQLAYHDNTQTACGRDSCDFAGQNHDYGYVVLGLWFSNRWDDQDPRALTLNYQVILWDSHFDARPEPEYRCDNRNVCAPDAGGWYTFTNSWAYSDHIGDYVAGSSCLTARDHSWQEYQLDVLPEVVRLITEDLPDRPWPYPPDPSGKREIEPAEVGPALTDLSRWKLVGLYLGTGIQGKMVITTRYRQLRITAQPKG